MTPETANLRCSTSFAYDLQKLRIQQGNRSTPKGEDAETHLTEKQQKFMTDASDVLLSLEKKAFTNLNHLLKPIDIYEWLTEQKGVGPTMSAVLLSYIDIERCETVSQLWSYCGLSVSGGKAQVRKRGEKANYNPFLKTKLIGVMGPCILKCGAEDSDNKSPWRKFYDNYKHRKENELVPVCQLCKGEGIWKSKDAKEAKACWNCDGTGGPAPWGTGDNHRHNAAMRYMVKMFLKEFHKVWREQEGLPVRPGYEEQYLGRKHHAA